MNPSSKSERLVVVLAIAISIAAMFVTVSAQRDAHAALATIAAMQATQATQQDLLMNMIREMEERNQLYGQGFEDLYANQQLLADAAGVPVESAAETGGAASLERTRQESTENMGIEP